MFVTLFAVASGTALSAVTVTDDESVIFYAQDALGSPLAVSDELGRVLWYENTQPYGKTLNRFSADGGGFVDNGAEQTLSRIGFTGHQADTTTGLVYMKARYYDPHIGRFYSNDPIGFRADTPGLFNRYAYAYNNPYRYTDPIGMEGEEESTQSRIERERQQVNEVWNNFWSGLGEALSSGADVVDDTMVETYSSETAASAAFGGGLVVLAVKAKKIKKKLTRTLAALSAGFSNFDQLKNNPELLRDVKPEKVEAILGDAPGWKVGVLAQGSAKGSGLRISEIGASGKATGRYVRYHPGNAPHKENKNSYWTVGSPESGKSDSIFNSWRDR